MPDEETLGSRLLRLRSEKGLTQKEVAEPEYTASYISTIEAGRRKPSIEAIAHFASRMGVDPKEILTGQPKDLDVQIGLGLQRARMLVYEGRTVEAIELAATTRREARRFEMSEDEARSEIILGLAHRRSGDAEKALRHQVRALELLGGAPPSGRVDAIVEIGRCYRALGDLRYSIHVLESFVDEMERRGLSDPRALMLANATLVGSYFAAGLFPQAAAAGDEAQRLAPMVSDPHEVANLHISVAQVLTHEGHRDEALRALARAETIYEGLSWSAQLASAKLAKGIAQAAGGDAKRAKATFLEALSALTGSPNKTGKARTLIELARLERSEGDIQRASGLLQEAQDVLNGADGAELALCYLEMGHCERESDPSGAEKNLKIALDIYRRIEDPSGQAEALKALGDLLTEQGAFEEAALIYRDGIEIASDAVRSEFVDRVG
jgi:tetratricopeptide (TPR) repeat protein